MHVCKGTVQQSMSETLNNVVVSATERALLMMGWERRQKHKHTTFEDSAYGAGKRSKTKVSPKASGNKTVSHGYKEYDSLKTKLRKNNWERDMPTLKVRTVNPQIQRQTGGDQQTWTSDGFDAAANTGTV